MQEVIEDSHFEEEGVNPQEDVPKVGRLQFSKSTISKASEQTDISQGKLEGIVEISITIFVIFITSYNTITCICISDL